MHRGIPSSLVPFEGLRLFEIGRKRVLVHLLDEEVFKLQVEGEVHDCLVFLPGHAAAQKAGRPTG